ncbi:MAG: glycosyltransferase family 2 protein [Bacteroidales bacterium]
MNNLQISIITVNRNNADGLAQTLESVRAQKKRNQFEYIVIDGASIDTSQIIIRENEDIIDFQISEPDKGIYDAMNKGVLKATGKYVYFLNSGDVFCNDNVIYNIKKLLPKTSNCIFLGGVEIKNHYFSMNWVLPKKLSYFDFLEGFCHQAMFIPLELLIRENGYKTQYKIVADWVFMMDCFRKNDVKWITSSLLITNYNTFGVSSSPRSKKQIENEKKQYFQSNSENEKISWSYFFYRLKPRVLYKRLFFKISGFLKV